MKGNISEFFSRFFPKGAILPHLIPSYSHHVINRNLERIMGNSTKKKKKEKYKRKGSSRHQYPKKVSSTKNQRGMVGHEVAYIWCGTQAKTQ